jgi:hypothetical protein
LFRFEAENGNFSHRFLGKSQISHANKTIFQNFCLNQCTLMRRGWKKDWYKHGYRGTTAIFTVNPESLSLPLA